MPTFEIDDIEFEAAVETAVDNVIHDAVADALDVSDIASEVQGNLDVSDIANEVQEYLDYDEIVRQVEDNLDIQTLVNDSLDNAGVSFDQGDAIAALERRIKTLESAAYRAAQAFGDVAADSEAEKRHNEFQHGYSGGAV